MRHFAGRDVSVEETAICIVDEMGKVVRELRAASEPDALIETLATTGPSFGRSDWKHARSRHGSVRGWPLTFWKLIGWTPPNGIDVRERRCSITTALTRRCSSRLGSPVRCCGYGATTTTMCDLMAGYPFGYRSDPEIHDDLRTCMAGMNDRALIFFSSDLGGHSVATRAPLAGEAFSNLELFSARSVSVLKLESAVKLIPNSYDPPEHTAYRRLFDRNLFSPRALASLGAYPLPCVHAV